MTDPPLTPDCLTRRQREVAALIASGLTDKQVGATLDIADSTVRVHVVALAFMLHVRTDQNTRVHIARWWWEHDPITTEAA